MAADDIVRDHYAQDYEGSPYQRGAAVVVIVVVSAVLVAGALTIAFGYYVAQHIPIPAGW